MPIVPFAPSPARSPLPGRAAPDEPWALMAAAQMHAEGRLIQAADTSDFRRSPNIEDRRFESITAKELDNRAVDDMFRPARPTPEGDPGRLGRALGAGTLDLQAAQRGISR